MLKFKTKTKKILSLLISTFLIGSIGGTLDSTALAKDNSKLEILDLNGKGNFSIGEKQDSTAEIIIDNGEKAIKVFNPSVGGAFSTIDVTNDSKVWSCKGDLKISTIVKNVNNFPINVRMKITDNDNNAKVFLKDIQPGTETSIDAINFEKGYENDGITSCWGDKVDTSKIKKISILVFEDALKKDNIEEFTYLIKSISMVGDVETVKLTTNNNPANEVLKDNPTVLPFSDKDNIRKWKLSETMSDEFEGQTLDTTKWSNDHRFWDGRQPSCFDPKNVSLRDGKLVLTSQWEDELTDAMKEANSKLPEGAQQYKDISASCVQSILPTGYGYYEIKARTAPISISSAFWFRNPTLKPIQEIDVFEQVGRPANFNLAKNGSDYPMNTHYVVDGVDTSSAAIYNTGYDLTADFHVYGLEWDENFLRYYIDGELIHEINNNIAKKIDKPQFVLFDMETWIYGCAPPSKEDFNYKEGERNPADFEIEYFRAWRSDVPQSSKPSQTAMNKIPEPKEAQAIFGSPIINSDSKEVDSLWKTAKEIGSYRYKRGDQSTPISVITKTMWDDKYFYVYNEVTDSEIFKNSDEKKIQESDNTELYIDALNEKNKDGFDKNDYCIKVYPDGTTISYGGVPDGIVTNAIITETGYVTQYKIPWTHISAKEGTIFGFDVQINQASKKSNVRDAILGWNDNTNNTWKTLCRSGNMKLVSSTEPDTDKPDIEDPDTEKPDTDKPTIEQPNTDKPDTNKPNTPSKNDDLPKTGDSGQYSLILFLSLFLLTSGGILLFTKRRYKAN